MAWSLPVLTAVLLGIGVPPSDVVSARGEAPYSQTCVARQSSGRLAIDASEVARAGEFLRARSEGSEPSPQAIQAWNEFFPKCDKLVHQYAARLQSRGVDPQDCAQETWSQLLRTLPNFRLEAGRGQFNSWLYTVVRSKANDILRRAVREPAKTLPEDATIVARDGDPAQALDRQETVQYVREALAELQSAASEQSYRVLHLRHVEGMSVAEVATAMGITPEQVWARDHRMRSKLRELLLGNVPRDTGVSPVLAMS